MSTLFYENLPFFSAISAAAIAKIRPPYEDNKELLGAPRWVDPQDLSNIAWAFAKFQYRDMPLLSAISSASIPQIREFCPRGILNTLWSYAERGCDDGPLFNALSAAALARCREFKVHVLSDIAW